MRRTNRLLSCLCALLFALSVPAEAQQPTKIPRIGYLSGSSLAAAAARVAAFQHGLRDLGYVEGKNIVIEWRSGEGKLDRNLAHAAELVRLKVDIIVAAGATEIRAAREATATVPIVMIRGAILLEAVSSPVWRGREGTLLDWRPFARS